MLPSFVGAAFLVAAGVFCLLAAGAFARAYVRHRAARYNTASWFDATAWPVFLAPAVAGVAFATLLPVAPFAAETRLALSVLLGAGLLLLVAGLVLRSRVRVSTAGVATRMRSVRWSAVDDYAETPAGLTLFYQEGALRRRFDVPVPYACRHRVAQITSACLDARFEYAARVYAGHQALEG